MANITLGTGGPPTPEEKLEKMLQDAFFDEGNNQNGTGPKNPSKELRAKRRATKLARKRNRDRER